MTGRTHNHRYELFHISEAASAGVKQFAETGHSELLDGILGDQQQQQPQQQLSSQLSNKNNNHYSSNSGNIATTFASNSNRRGPAEKLTPSQPQLASSSHSSAISSRHGGFDEFNLPAILSGEGRSETKFFVDSNHSLVSLITRIVPSPDWFIGIDSFQVIIML